MYRIISIPVRLHLHRCFRRTWKSCEREHTSRAFFFLTSAVKPKHFLLCFHTLETSIYCVAEILEKINSRDRFRIIRNWISLRPCQFQSTEPKTAVLRVAMNTPPLQHKYFICIATIFSLFFVVWQKFYEQSIDWRNSGSRFAACKSSQLVRQLFHILDSNIRTMPCHANSIIVFSFSVPGDLNWVCGLELCFRILRGNPLSGTFRANYSQLPMLSLMWASRFAFSYFSSILSFKFNY
jgi:hypothetical protein